MAQDAAAAPPSPAPPRPQAPAAPPKAKRSPRRFMLPLVLIGAAAYGAHWGYDYFTEGRFLVSTDDAYVGADTVIVAPKIPGYVAEVQRRQQPGGPRRRPAGAHRRRRLPARRRRRQGQGRHAGRDDRRASAGRSRRSARWSRRSQAQIGAARAAADSADADEQRASLEFDRAQKLAQTSFGSQQRLEQATADKKRTAAAAAGAKSVARLGAGAAGLEQGQSRRAAEPEDRGRAHARRTCERGRARRARSLLHRDPRAVRRRRRQQGGRGRAISCSRARGCSPSCRSTRSMSTPISRRRSSPTSSRGRRSTSRSTPSAARRIEGVVRSIAPASGAQFSLLPPDNATGNFTKIVQRVTVRIGFDAEAVKAHDAARRACPSSRRCIRATNRRRSRR